MSLSNFLPINRQLQEHWIYKDSCYLHCWLEMLFNARYSEEEKTDIYKGVVYKINRGEFIFSRPSYSKRLNIPEGKIRTLIKLLISENMIQEVKSLGRNKPTIYKIINYDLYNSQPSEHVENKGVEYRIDQVTTKSQPSDNQVTTKSQPLKNIDNNDKKEKEKENIIKDIVEYLNEISGKNFKHNSNKTKSCINARLKEGFTFENFKTVINLKVSQWKDDVKMSTYIRPETLFGTKFEGYLNETPKIVSVGDKRIGVPPCESILPERDDNPWF